MSSKKAIGGSMAAIIVLVISQILAQLLASVFLVLQVPEGVCNIIAGMLYVGLTFGILKVFAEKVMKQELSELGIPGFSLKGRWILMAFLLPVAVKGSYILLFSGEYISSGMGKEQIFQILSAGIFFTGIAAGFVEEMIFRGVILNLLKKRWNVKVAVLIPSILFGVVHILGMDFSVGSCLLIVLAGTMVGIMFSLIAIESGSVWNSGIVHALWNILIIGGGLAIGETADEYAVMTYVLHTKAFAVTGGEFGIESSVIALIGYMVVAMIAYIMIRKERRV